MSSPCLWSLWDMLKKFEAEHTLGSLNYISQTQRKLRSDLEGMKIGPVNVYDLETTGERKNLIDCLNNMLVAAREYELRGVKVGVLEAKRFLLSEDIDFTQLSVDQTLGLELCLFGAHNTIMNVLAETGIYVLTRGSAEYVTGDRVGFGPQVEEAFPSASEEGIEASKCLGLERWTACVMHCMRALEPGLIALEQAVPVAFQKEQWGDKINQIEAAIKTLHKGNCPKEDVQWFSDAATQFHFVKNAWRNYSQHLLHTYDDERATEIFNASRSFMRHLATKLKEETKTA